MGKACKALHRSYAAADQADGGADPMAFSHEGHRRMIEAFIEAVRSGAQPLASGRSALPVHALIDAMLESSAKGTTLELGVP